MTHNIEPGDWITLSHEAIQQWDELDYQVAEVAKIGTIGMMVNVSLAERAKILETDTFLVIDTDDETVTISKHKFGEMRIRKALGVGSVLKKSDLKSFFSGEKVILTEQGIGWVRSIDSDYDGVSELSVYVKEKGDYKHDMCIIGYPCQCGHDHDTFLPIYEDMLVKF